MLDCALSSNNWAIFASRTSEFFLTDILLTNGDFNFEEIPPTHSFDRRLTFTFFWLSRAFLNSHPCEFKALLVFSADLFEVDGEEISKFGFRLASWLTSF